MQLNPVPDFQFSDRANIHLKNLKSQDKYRLLCQEEYEWKPYLQALVLLYTLIEQYGFELDEVTLFEFGAHHHRLGLIINNMAFNPSIAHFMALNGNQRYFAIDLGFNEENFNRELDYAKNEIATNKFLDSSTLFTYKDIDLDRLRQRVLERNLTHAQALDILRKNTSKNIIFSHQVFNDPNLNTEFPFWNFPGFHIHICSMTEMNKKLGINLYEINPGTYLEKLKKTLKLEEQISIIKLPNYYNYKTNGNLAFIWNNKK